MTKKVKTYDKIRIIIEHITNYPYEPLNYEAAGYAEDVLALIKNGRLEVSLAPEGCGRCGARCNASNPHTGWRNVYCSDHPRCRSLEEEHDEHAPRWCPRRKK